MKPAKSNVLGLMKLRRHLDRWCVNPSPPPQMEELCRIEYVLQNGGKPYISCKQTYDILQSCGIKMTQQDIGWKVI